MRQVPGLVCLSFFLLLIWPSSFFFSSGFLFFFFFPFFFFFFSSFVCFFLLRFCWWVGVLWCVACTTACLAVFRCATALGVPIACNLCECISLCSPGNSVGGPYSFSVPQAPPKGSPLSRPCVAFAMLLLLTALGLGIAAAAGKHWLSYSGGPGWDLNGLVLTTKAKAQISLYKIFVNDPPTINSRSINVMDYFNNVAGAYGVSNSYTQQLRDSIRVCRAFVIIGIVFSFLAAAACVATLVQYYNWKTYRMLRIVSCALALLAFASYLITFVVWLSVTQVTYTSDQNAGAAVRLKCSNCAFGWPVWLCLASFICALVAACCLLIAMEPKQNSWKAKALPHNTNTYYQSSPIMVPPPTPMVSTQPMMTVLQQPIVAPQVTTMHSEPYVLVNSAPPPMMTTMAPMTLNGGTVPYYY